MSRVSVVIPALNAQSSIGETLKALRTQQGLKDFELIVADNGSTDATPQIARTYGATVVREQTRGPAAARNAGLRAASGDIVAHLDADTVPSRRWLAELVQPFDDPATVLAAGRTICYPPKTAAERYVQQIGLYDASLAVKRTPFPFAPSLNLAVRRREAFAAGGWNERLITGEDVDFSHRVTKAFDTTVRYCERAVLYHHARADDEALVRQARSYGAGVADLYRMYPDEIAWNAHKAIHLAGVLATRAFYPAAARIGKRLRLIDDARGEFMHYHWLWTRNFWLGFARRRYAGGGHG